MAAICFAFDNTVRATFIGCGSPLHRNFQQGSVPFVQIEVADDLSYSRFSGGRVEEEGVAEADEVVVAEQEEDEAGVVGLEVVAEEVLGEAEGAAGGSEGAAEGVLEEVEGAGVVGGFETACDMGPSLIYVVAFHVMWMIFGVLSCTHPFLVCGFMFGWVALLRHWLLLQPWFEGHDALCSCLLDSKLSPDCDTPW
jgi:hypothetical protein